jgi:hypothetical protein
VCVHFSPSTCPPMPHSELWQSVASMLTMCVADQRRHHRPSLRRNLRIRLSCCYPRPQPDHHGPQPRGSNLCARLPRRSCWNGSVQPSPVTLQSLTSWISCMHAAQAVLSVDMVKRSPGMVVDTWLSISSALPSDSTSAAGNSPRFHVRCGSDGPLERPSRCHAQEVACLTDVKNGRGAAHCIVMQDGRHRCYPSASCTDTCNPALLSVRCFDVNPTLMSSKRTRSSLLSTSPPSVLIKFCRLRETCVDERLPTVLALFAGATMLFSSPHARISGGIVHVQSLPQRDNVGLGELEERGLQR